MRTHKIKLNEQWCDLVLSGDKTFEIRYNDRCYQKGDVIEFIPTNSRGDQTIKHDISKKRYVITFVFSGWVIEDDHVVLAIREARGEE